MVGQADPSRGADECLARTRPDRRGSPTARLGLRLAVLVPAPVLERGRVRIRTERGAAVRAPSRPGGAARLLARHVRAVRDRCAAARALHVVAHGATSTRARGAAGVPGRGLRAARASVVDSSARAGAGARHVGRLHSNAHIPRSRGARSHRGSRAGPRRAAAAVDRLRHRVARAARLGRRDPGAAGLPGRAARTPRGGGRADRARRRDGGGSSLRAGGLHLRRPAAAGGTLRGGGRRPEPAAQRPRRRGGARAACRLALRSVRRRGPRRRSSTAAARAT